MKTSTTSHLPQILTLPRSTKLEVRFADTVPNLVRYEGGENEGSPGGSIVFAAREESGQCQYYRIWGGIKFNFDHSANVKLPTMVCGGSFSSVWAVYVLLLFINNATNYLTTDADFLSLIK